MDGTHDTAFHTWIDLEHDVLYRHEPEIVWLEGIRPGTYSSWTSSEFYVSDVVYISAFILIACLRNQRWKELMIRHFTHESTWNMMWYTAMNLISFGYSGYQARYIFIMNIILVLCFRRTIYIGIHNDSLLVQPTMKGTHDTAFHTWIDLEHDVLYRHEPEIVWLAGIRPGIHIHHEHHSTMFQTNYIYRHS